MPIKYLTAIKQLIAVLTILIREWLKDFPIRSSETMIKYFIGFYAASP